MISQPIAHGLGMPIARGINAPPFGAFTFTAIVQALFRNGEQGVAYDVNDLSTLFQDSAGTTPATAADQPVGLVLDKSKGLVLGPELVTNGTFAVNTDGWVPGRSGTLSLSNGAMRVTNGAMVSGGASHVINCTVGRQYEIKMRIPATSGGVAFFRVADFDVDTATSSDFRLTLSGRGSGDYRAVFTATRTSHYVFAQIDGGVAGSWVEFDNISVRELPGNHASQPTAASRPLLARHPVTGKRNLLTRTEEFDNAVWSKVRSTASANSAIAPDGASTADKIVEDTTASNTHHVSTAHSFVSGMVYSYSVYAHVAERSALAMALPSATFGVDQRVLFDLVAKTAVTQNGTPTSEIQELSGGWFRLRITATATATATSAVFAYLGSGGSIAYTGDGTSGIYIWGAQLEVGSTATPYQKVTSAQDITEAGVPDLYHLAFDGIDDFLVTGNINFTGTDKVSLFAGMRKLSDATSACLVEFSSAAESAKYAFAVFAPGGSGAEKLSFRSVGLGALANANTGVSGPAAPVSVVLTGAASISDDYAALRVNGAQAAVITTDQGPGNYGNYPLYIGRRAGTSLPFNGHLYSLIITGRLTADAETRSTERLLAKRVGVQLA